MILQGLPLNSSSFASASEVLYHTVLRLLFFCSFPQVDFRLSEGGNVYI